MFKDFKELDSYYREYESKHHHPTIQDLTHDGINKYPNILFPNQEENIYRSNCVEFWKYVTDNEIPYIEPNNYLISNFGNTWDTKMNCPIHIVKCESNKFYEQVNLRVNDGPYPLKTIKLHKLILMLFAPIENPHDYQVNHIDGIHDNNVLYNLEWCDDSYNRIHSIINGVGTNNFSRQIIQLTPEIVHKIKVYREDMGYQTHKIYFELMPELQQISSYDNFRHLIPKIATGRSLYSQFYY